MRHMHTAGEKTFIDYAGQRSSVVDPTTGEVVPVELFVAVLGASNYTFAEATPTQRSRDFIQSHTRAVEYFGGVTLVMVPDQLRTGVTDPYRYEPTIQRTYEDWARHYGTAIVPARPAKLGLDLPDLRRPLVDRPQRLDRIALNLRIVGHDRQAVLDRLAYQHPVEWVPVKIRKLGDVRHRSFLNRQGLNAQALSRLEDERPGRHMQRELTGLGLDRDLPG